MKEIVSKLSLLSIEDRFKYFLNLSNADLSDTDKIILMVYMYTNNVVLFKLNIRSIIHKYGLKLYIDFVKSTYLYNTVIDRDFLIQTILVKLCTVKNIQMPEINFQAKEELNGMELANHKFAQSIAFTLYSNGKRSYYNICKSYNKLIRKNNIIDYSQIILQKDLINFNDPSIESLYKLKGIQNVIITPI